MMRMTLNNTVEIEINHYNRYTEIRDGKISASASFGLTDTSAYDSLIALNNTIITAIKIENDEKVLYNLTNQNARISRINENVYTEGVNVDVGIIFNDDGEEVE